MSGDGPKHEFPEDNAEFTGVILEKIKRIAPCIAYCFIILLIPIDGL